MGSKRALAIFETGQPVRICTLDLPHGEETALETAIVNLMIVKDQPDEFVIELGNGITLHFLGTWGVNDKNCPRRPDY